MAGITRTTTHGIWRLFVHGIRLEPGSARYARGVTHEQEPPFRAARPLILRVGRTAGFAIGWWRDTEHDEDGALRAALAWEGSGGHDLDLSSVLD